MTKDEARHLCKTDRMYLAKVLGYDFQPDVHPDMFAALSKGDKHNRLVLWPRGHFKTSCVTVDIVGNILNNPDARIMTMQATLKLTKGWIRELASHFNGKNPNSKLLSLFSDFEIESGDALGFTVKARSRKHLKEPTVAAASPKAVSTGQHYSDGYFDDLVNALNYRNVELLDSLETEFNHYQPLIDPGGYVTVTGTRYSYADLYQRIIKRNRGEWVTSIRPCYKPDGSLLFPARQLADGRTIGFTIELLTQLKQDDPETFSAQYLNEILSGSQQMFPESLILGAIRSVEDKEYPATASKFFFIDLAESSKADSDSSVITIGQQDAWSRVWILDCIGHTWSPAVFGDVVLQQTIKHRPARIYIEKQPGSEFFAEFLRNIAREKHINVPIEVVAGSRQKGAKAVRISSLESFLKHKRLFFCAGIRDRDKLVEEFTQFPRGRHDDRPDCIALLVNKLTQAHFPQAPVQLKSFDVVRAVFDTDSKLEDCRSLCGDGFA